MLHTLRQHQFLDIHSKDIGLLYNDRGLHLVAAELVLGQSWSLVKVKVLQELHGVGFFLAGEELGDAELLLGDTPGLSLEGEDELVFRKEHVDGVLWRDVVVVEFVDYLAGDAVHDID